MNLYLHPDTAFSPVAVPQPARIRSRTPAGFSLVLALVFAIPWGDMILLPYNIQASRLFSVLVFLVWLSTLLGSRVLKKPPGAQVFMILFAAWAGASSLWTPEIEASARRALSYCQLFLIVWLLCQYAIDAEAYRKLLAAYVCGAWVGLGGILYRFASGMFQGDGRYTAPGFDPNDLAVTLALGVPMACYLEFTGAKRNWITFLYTPVALAGGMLTASRSGAVAMGVCLLFPLLAWRRVSRHAKIRFAVLCLASVALVTALWSDLSIGRLTSFAEQFSRQDLNGRVDVWQVAYAAFLENPILGLGGGSFMTAIGFARGTARAVHSTFLGVLVEHGVVGVFLFLAILGALGRKAWANPPLERRLWFVLLFAWSLAATSLSWENRETTWLLWGLCLAQPLRRVYRIRPILSGTFPHAAGNP